SRADCLLPSAPPQSFAPEGCSDHEPADPAAGPTSGYPTADAELLAKPLEAPSSRAMAESGLASILTFLDRKQIPRICPSRADASFNSILSLPRCQGSVEFVRSDSQP